MLTKRLFPLLFSTAFALQLAGCAGVAPVRYTGLDSSARLTPSSTGNTTKVPYSYTSNVVWSQYTQVMVDPVVIYQGSDNQFGTMSEADRQELAGYMAKAFSKKLKTQYPVVKKTGTGVLRVRLTLTGAGKTTPVVGQFTHFDIGGNLYNGIQATAGGKAAFGGWVAYSVEVYDSKDGQLLKAYVSKQYPNALNLPAAFGSLGAAETGLDKGADALLAQLR